MPTRPSTSPSSPRNRPNSDVFLPRHRRSNQPGSFSMNLPGVAHGLLEPSEIRDERNPTSRTCTSTSCEVETSLPGDACSFGHDNPRRGSAFDAGAPFDEGAVVGDVVTRPVKRALAELRLTTACHGSSRQTASCRGDSVRFVVDLDDLHLHRLAMSRPRSGD